MRFSAFTQARAVCAYFFVGPGLVYGMFTSRMPALTQQADANEAQIGLVLLCLGISGMFSLAVCAWIIDRFTSRAVLRIRRVKCVKQKDISDVEYLRVKLIPIYTRLVKERVSASVLEEGARL